MEVNMKEWILRYAEQQNEEEKSESSKNLDDEEKFDPVSGTPSQASSILGITRHSAEPYLLFVFLTFELDK